jgi:hypothetical protein
MKKKKILGTASVLVCTLLLLTISPTQAAQAVAIEIKDGSIVSMTPSELLANTDYEIRVKVLDNAGTPIQGAKVSLSVSGGTVEIVGDSSAITGSDGVAILRTTFDEGGIVKLLLDGKTVEQLFVYYSSLPPLVGFLVAVFTILLCGSLAYLVYAGPVKWYLEERARK